MIEKQENSVEIFYKDVLRTWHQDGDTLREIEHLYCGLLDEIGELASAYKKHVGYGKELDLVNVKEELGDIFYFLILFTKYQEKGENNRNKMFTILITDKFYDKTPLKAATFFLLTEPFSQLNRDPGNILILFILVCEIMYFYGLTFEEVTLANMEKREVRFPGGYTQDKATNRDLDSERKTLEK